MLSGWREIDAMGCRAQERILFVVDQPAGRRQNAPSLLCEGLMVMAK